MYMLLLVANENGALVDGVHMQWCSACDLAEATQRARDTEAANSNRITVAVVDECYTSYADGTHYSDCERLDYAPGWQTIVFSDGSNPYVCKTREEFVRVSKKYLLRKIKEGFWEAKIFPKDPALDWLPESEAQK